MNFVCSENPSVRSRIAIGRELKIEANKPDALETFSVAARNAKIKIKI